MNSTIVTNYDYFANVKIDIEKAVSEASTIDGVLIMVKTEIDELVGIKRWASFSQFTKAMTGIEGYTEEPIYAALKVAFSRSTWPAYVYTYGLKLNYADKYITVDGEQKPVYKLYSPLSRYYTNKTDFQTLSKYSYSLRFEVSSDNKSVAMNGANSETLKSASEAIIKSWLTTQANKAGFTPLSSYFNSEEGIDSYGVQITGAENVLSDAHLNYSYSTMGKGNCQTSIPVIMDSDMVNFLKDNGYNNISYAKSKGTLYYYPTSVILSHDNEKGVSAIMYGDKSDGTALTKSDDRKIYAYSVASNEEMAFHESINGVSTQRVLLGYSPEAAKWTETRESVVGYGGENKKFVYCYADTKKEIPCDVTELEGDEKEAFQNAINSVLVDGAINQANEIAFINKNCGYIKARDGVDPSILYKGDLRRAYCSDENGTKELASFESYKNSSSYDSGIKTETAYLNKFAKSIKIETTTGSDKIPFTPCLARNHKICYKGEYRKVYCTAASSSKELVSYSDWVKLNPNETLTEIQYLNKNAKFIRTCSGDGTSESEYVAFSPIPEKFEIDCCNYTVVNMKKTAPDGKIKFNVGVYIPFSANKTIGKIYKRETNESGKYIYVNSLDYKPNDLLTWWERFPLDLDNMQIEFPSQNEEWKNKILDKRTHYTYKFNASTGVATPVVYTESYSDEQQDGFVAVTTNGKTSYIKKSASAAKMNTAYENAFGKLPAIPDQEGDISSTIYTLNVYFCGHGFIAASSVSKYANNLYKEYVSKVEDIDSALTASMNSDAWYVICPIDGEIPGKTEDDKDFSFTLEELRKISERVEGAEKMAVFTDTGYLKNKSTDVSRIHSFYDKMSDNLTPKDLADGYKTAISKLPFTGEYFNYGNFVRTAVIYGPYTEYKSEYESSDSSIVSKKTYDNCRNLEWALVWLENYSGTETAAFKTLKNQTAPSYSEVWTELLCGDLTSVEELEQTDGANYNLCTNIGGKCITLNGKTLAGEWMDVVRFRDWLIITMRKEIAKLFMKRSKIPFTNEGINMITSVVRGVLTAGQTRGGISKDYIDEDGETIGGYIVTSPDITKISQYMRQRRKLSGISFRAKLTGAIHFAEIKGTLAYGDTEVIG